MRWPVVWEWAVPALAFLGADLSNTLAVLPAQLMGCTGVQSAIIGPRRELGNPGFCNLGIMLQPRSMSGLTGMAPGRACPLCSCLPQPAAQYPRISQHHEYSHPLEDLVGLAFTAAFLNCPD